MTCKRFRDGRHERAPRRGSGVIRRSLRAPLLRLRVALHNGRARMKRSRVTDANHTNLWPTAPSFRCRSDARAWCGRTARKRDGCMWQHDPASTVECVHGVRERFLGIRERLLGDPNRRRRAAGVRLARRRAFQQSATGLGRACAENPRLARYAGRTKRTLRLVSRSERDAGRGKRHETAHATAVSYDDPRDAERGA